MALIESCENFTVGHELIDADHRALINHLNLLYAAVAANAGIEEQSRLLEALITSTETHFKHEEALMSKMGFEGLAKHKAEHDMLLDEVRELQVRFNSGSITLTDSWFDYLSEWLNFHTVTTDKKLADAVARADK
ncbi:MAG: bacteriohemerythrin [Formivibrio sp.]|nr:bacteriohemerythrin [Formivibrio sp.]